MLAKLFSRFAKAPAPLAQVPEGRRIYAIGDIHGHLDLLDGLLAQIFADERTGGVSGELIFLGDLINRGPQSAQVIDRLIGLRAQRPETRFLLGNHEELFLTALDGNREAIRSEEHTSELQSLMRSSYAVFCLKKKTHHN